MTKLNKTALEAAYEAIGGNTYVSAIPQAIEAFIRHPDAGLVERSELEAELDEQAEHSKQQRDELYCKENR